ncbi:hypothetical protein S245_071463 [Arachis hypogaea]|uniref:RING-type domain-containing protein n=1 Tax=Arachis hypogaea TaxID=3818 RepID=A0A444X7W7_ARAHY|nr:hypothetical protein Ahy_B10g105359 [Arachis hypogaea]
MASAISASDPSLFKDPAKKKKGNGSAKLKQIKLDVRREQWLSRVKKGSNVDSNRSIDYSPSSKHIPTEENRSSYKENKKRGEDTESSCIPLNDSSIPLNDSTSIRSPLDQESRNGFSSWSSTSISSMSTCFSGSEEEADDDGCLDDWEAVADALNANDNRRSTTSDSASTILEATKNPKLEFKKSHQKRQAWKPNDAFRPMCLPNLSKQHSSSLNSNRNGGNPKPASWRWQTIISQPSQCPICYEDLDVTDTSFLPCSCKFRPCLFCHKRILEADGRCPGCRKLYECVDVNVMFRIGANAFHITQSCTMSTRC